MRVQGKEFKTIWKIFLCITILSFFLVKPCSSAEDPAKYPSRPITFIVQWAPGGTTDLSARKISDLASKILGQPIIVENKVGGSGITGANAVAKSEPDGYTIGVVSYSSTVILPHIRSVPYDTKKDFTWIMQYGEYSHIFCVLANSPWRTFKEFIEEARKNPGKLKYAPPGPLSGQHVFMESVFSKEKVKVTFVPVGGGSEADIQLLGGHIDAAVSPSLFSHIKSGKVRGLMGVQMEKRLEEFPDIPTHYEMGYGIESPNWVGIYAPKGLDPRISKKLFDAYKKAHEDPSFKEMMAKMYMPMTFRDSESFRVKVLEDFDAQGRVLKELGLVK